MNIFGVIKNVTFEEVEKLRKENMKKTGIDKVNTEAFQYLKIKNKSK